MKTTKKFQNIQFTNYIIPELEDTNKWEQMLGKINIWDMTENKEKKRSFNVYNLLPGVSCKTIMFEVK